MVTLPFFQNSPMAIPRIQNICFNKPIQCEDCQFIGKSPLPNRNLRTDSEIHPKKPSTKIAGVEGVFLDSFQPWRLSKPNNKHHQFFLGSRKTMSFGDGTSWTMTKKTWEWRLQETKSLGLIFQKKPSRFSTRFLSWWLAEWLNEHFVCLMAIFDASYGEVS